MPRRYYDYLPQYQTLHVLATVGSWILILGILIMFGNLLVALKRGRVVKEMNPWGGRTLEWAVPSPPPKENFPTAPVLTHDPYDYSIYDRPAEAQP
jgi:cytochrome c oxidase subunit 1